MRFVYVCMYECMLEIILDTKKFGKAKVHSTDRSPFKACLGH